MKNCPKCGVELPDEAVFCNNCGNSLSADNAQPSAQAAPTAAPVNNATLDSAVEKNKNTKVGMIAIIGGAAVVLILVIALLASAIGGGNYKTPIKGLAKALNSRSTDLADYVDCFVPNFVADAYNDIFALLKDVDEDLVEDFNDDMTDTFEDLYDDWDDQFGDDWKVSYEIRDAEELDDDELEEIQECYEDLYDSLDDLDLDDEETYEDFADMMEDEMDVELSDSQIKKLQKICETLLAELEDVEIRNGYMVDIKLTIEGDEDDDDEKFEIPVIEVNGGWCIDFISWYGINDIYDIYWLL